MGNLETQPIGVTTELVESTVGQDIAASVEGRRQALVEVEDARAALARAKSRVQSSEANLGDQHKVAYAFTLKVGSEPLVRNYFTQDYDDEREYGWDSDGSDEILPGEVFTARNYVEADYDHEVLRLEMEGDRRKSRHGEFTQSGREVKSTVEIPFSRLGDLEIYEFYPNDPERTEEVCALLAGKLGVEQVVLHNGPLIDYQNVRRWAAEKAVRVIT